MSNLMTQIEEIINLDLGNDEIIITAEVDQALLKTNNPLKNNKVTKIVEYTVKQSKSYSELMNEKLLQEGEGKTYEPKQSWHLPLKYGKNGSIVYHKNDINKTYLKVMISNTNTLKYFVDGVEANNEQLKSIKEYKQKVNNVNDIPIRLVKTDSIKNIVLHKVIDVSNN